MPAMRIAFPTLLALLLATAGCDSSKPAPKPDDAKQAAEQAESDKRIEERRKKREAEAKAKADAEAKVKAQIDALCVVPEGAKPPKKLEAACQAVVDAQMAFMERLYAEEPEVVEKFKKAAKMQNQMTMNSCTGTNIKVAMCQKAALDAAPKELRKSLPDLLRTCIEKFGAPPKGEGVVPKKPG